MTLAIFRATEAALSAATYSYLHGLHSSSILLLDIEACNQFKCYKLQWAMQNCTVTLKPQTVLL